MSKSVLIAGCGDVGLRAAWRLREAGHAVVGLRRSAQALPGEINTFAADLTDPDTLRGLPRDITHVVYLPTPDRRDAAAYEAVFLTGLAHLLDALDTTRLQRVVFVSSSAVYGEHDGEWIDEDTPANPPGFNGEILLRAERWLAAHALPGVVLRLAGLYGPGRSRLLQRLSQGAVNVPRETPFWANRIHVDDAAAAIVHLLELAAPAPCYLGVDDMPLPLAVLYDHLAAQIGAPQPGTGAPPAGIGNKRLSNARLRDSGFALRWPDCRHGYAALLAGDAAVR